MAQHSSGGGLGGIVKIGLIGGAAYFGYNYLVNSGLWAEWFGGSAAIPPATVPINTPASSSTTPPATSTPPAATTPPPAPLAPVSRTALIAAAGGPAVTLDVDQWVYYYQQLTGTQVTGGQVNTLLGATNQTAANRGALLSVDQFLAALPTAGLSGFGAARPVLARASWGARTPARALPPNYVRRGAPMIRRR
jgi:hypothetical protein